MTDLTALALVFLVLRWMLFWISLNMFTTAFFSPAVGISPSRAMAYKAISLGALTVSVIVLFTTSAF